jgi:hypothetical protein
VETSNLTNIRVVICATLVKLYHLSVELKNAISPNSLRFIRCSFTAETHPGFCGPSVRNTRTLHNDEPKDHVRDNIGGFN